MSDIPKYDVIIAGGGPAGSTAGYLLSKSGSRVLIIDKSTFPRKKLCGGLITYKTVRLLERVFGETADSLREKGIINYESRRYRVFNRSSLITQHTMKHPFMFVDRERYDHYLLEKALHAGAALAEGDGVRSLDMLRSTVTTMSGKKYAGDIIIGADGVNSRIRRSFLVDLFGREDWSGNLAAAHEIILDRSAVKKDYSEACLFFGYIDWGYAWIFPNRDRLKIGICALMKEVNKKDLLAAFRTFISTMDLHGAETEKMHSYVLPYGSFLPSPVFRNVMLAGDAAGFADPLLGEGIFYAQRSAELASQAVLAAAHINRTDAGRKQTGKLYVESLNKYIYPELVYAGKIRNAIFTYYNKAQYLPLKILMSIFGDKPSETLQGIRSYRWMKKLDNV